MMVTYKVRKEKAHALFPVQRVYAIRLCIVLAICVLAGVLSPFGYHDSWSILYQTLGGGVFATDGSVPSAFAILLCVTPTFIFCYLFSDYLRNSLEHAGAYVFTRTIKRGNWLRIRLIQLGGFVCAYSFSGGVFVGALLFLQKGMLGDATVQGWQVVFNFFLPAVTLNMLMLLALLIPVNILALRLHPLAGFITVMAFYFASLLLCASAPHSITANWAPLLPTTQGVFAWHDTVFTQIMFSPGVIEGFSLGQSYAYLLVLVAFEIVFSVVSIKRIELL
ncbi:MAG: hypothetical protein LBU07_05575 [Coriobacteriales bacterium]|jgi:hypothetical protein|nr:hypothetical protein [Coriobacteriales bacterium]